MKPVRVYFVCSFLRGLYCLKVCSFQLMENRRVSILKLMGMGSHQYLLASIPRSLSDHLVKLVSFHTHMHVNAHLSLSNIKGANAVPYLAVAILPALQIVKILSPSLKHVNAYSPIFRHTSSSSC